MKMTTPTDKEIKHLRPNWLRRRLAKWALLPYRMRLGFLIGKQVLILTTRGRVSTKDRRTPLWYVSDGDNIYCLSGWGASSDWWKNPEANPKALLQIGMRRWELRGEVIAERQKVERILSKFQKKYGRRTVSLFYHLDRLVLVTFPKPSQVQDNDG